MHTSESLPEGLTYPTTSAALREKSPNQCCLPASWEGCSSHQDQALLLSPARNTVIRAKTENTSKGLLFWRLLPRRAQRAEKPRLPGQWGALGPLCSARLRGRAARGAPCATPLHKAGAGWGPDPSCGRRKEQPVPANSCTS